MNNTKWTQLLEIIESLPFPPAFVFKTFDEDADNDFLKALDKPAVDYWGDWQLNSGPGSLPAADKLDRIEYIRIKPAYAKYRGKYAEAEIMDVSDALIAALTERQIPFESDEYSNIVIRGMNKLQQ